MAASHSGEDRHVSVVEGLLRRGALPVSALSCGTHAPYDAETAERLIRDGEPLTPLRHNCSGKHAGMLLFASTSGWPTQTYWHRDHQVQRAVLHSIAVATDVAVDKIALATDGCGVPTLGMPLRALARAFARLAAGSDETLRRISDAMTAHPELVGGERRRLDTALMRARPGLISKAGAEGIHAVALREGTVAGRGPLGMALVVEDGDAARRASGVAACAALRQLGVLDAAALAALDQFAEPRVLDPRGNVSGSVRAPFSLEPVS